MFRTTKNSLINHLRDDFQIENNAIIWLHIGLRGLGIIENGLETLNTVFSNILSKGVLILPAFSYSWSNSKTFNINEDNCREVGNYSSYSINSKLFYRTSNPNFSVSIMDNSQINFIENVKNSKSYLTCFGNDSIFDIIYEKSKSNPAYIILLGGAHDDTIFRSTFIHYIEEKVGVPYRYKKKFYDPLNSKKYISQYVRYLNKDEYFRVNRSYPKFEAKFPVKQNFEKMGRDLIKDNLIKIKKYGYSATRLVKVNDYCQWLEKKIKQDPLYLI